MRALCAPGVHDAALALLARHLPGRARLVDLGAGEGALSARLRALGHEVVAAERDATRFEAPDVPVVPCDLDGAFAERIGEGRFDGCMALEVIEHLESPWGFLRQCRALLRPGGILVLSTPNVESTSSRLLFLWNGRLRFFTDGETHHISPILGGLLHRGLLRAGLNPLETTYNRDALDCGRSRKARLAALAGKALTPVLRGDRRGEIRLVAARAG